MGLIFVFVFMKVFSVPNEMLPNWIFVKECRIMSYLMIHKRFNQHIDQLNPFQLILDYMISYHGLPFESIDDLHNQRVSFNRLFWIQISYALMCVNFIRFCMATFVYTPQVYEIFVFNYHGVGDMRPILLQTTILLIAAMLNR